MHEERYDNGDIVELALSILAEEMRLWTGPRGRTQTQETTRESRQDRP
jgi:hypothetical protein